MNNFVQKASQTLLSDRQKHSFIIEFLLVLLAIFVHVTSILIYSKVQNPNLSEITGFYFIITSFCLDTIFLFFIPESFCYLQFIKLLVYIPISRFTNIYIYEFLHIVIQYCISIFWNREFVLQKNQKELCDYSKIFEYQKYKEKLHKNKAASFAPYCITLVVFLLFSWISRRFIEAAIILILTFYISYRTLFFSILYNNSKNGIPCNEMDFKSLEALENPIPVFSILIPVLGLALVTNLNLITGLIVLISLIIVFIQDLWHFENMRINGIKAYQKYFLLFVAIVALLFLYFIVEKRGTVLAQSNLQGIIIPVVSAVFIFNFSAICYLIQENYHKYNSVLLIKESLNFPTLLFTIIIPACFVLLFILTDLVSNRLLFYSIAATTYSWGSSIWLLFRIRFLLNDRKIILRLMARVSKDDIDDYCEHLNINSENPIDTMQKVLTLIIKNDDVNLAEDCFNILFKWIALNLDCIYEESNNYWKIRQNRFNKFLIGLSQEISKADNYVMRQNFSYSIYETVLLQSEIKLIKRYELIYMTLENFIKNELEKDDRYSEKVAENAFHILISMVPKYLYSMECKECLIDGFSFLNESDDWRMFNEIIIKSIKECVDFAIDKNRIEFLKSTYLITRMFREYEEPFSISEKEIHFKWNDNVYRLLNEVTSIYYRILIKITNDSVIKHIEWEYRLFAHLITKLNYSTPVQRAIFNSFYNSYYSFITRMLDSKRHFVSDEFFELVCETVYNKCSCQEYFNSYMKLFFFTAEKTLQLYYEDKKLLKSDDLMRIVGRIKQLQEYLQTECDFKFEKAILDVFDEYEKRYPEVFVNYEEYDRQQNVYYAEIKKALQHI